ncbi:hypothetical protein EDD17DRAFT_1874731 [Pisolithus thermaeus]|nr:hypothetical protein EV401DRAFT_2125873 [Pisolithus croceorrhizus]KAI6161610.1 hypothetical protein EDD17DRAFT_1874731 [Pisolithus thermaeus]
MDYLPELTHNGHNWTTYASLVLCAISDEGLMGFLVGSERRPTHPAELIGRGEGWTPQTDDEREEVAAWRAADQLWTQRNAMVNYTIVCSIPDTIFGSMLHLKSPLEKWTYLEDHFGRIPRPECWLVAEEAEQRSNSNMATETGQDTHNSDDESRDLPGSQNEPTDSPSDCAETEAGQANPKPEVVDAQHLKPYLRGMEVEAIGSKQPAEGTNVLKAPDEGSQCASDKAEEEDDLPMSSDALETPGDLPFTSSECAETQTGHTKPEDEVADTWHVVDVLPMFEVGSIGQAWYGKHAKELQAPNEGGQHTDNKVERSRDLPKSSSEVLKPMSIEDSQRAWTNSETIANVPDPPSTLTKHPTPQVESSMLRKWPLAQACSATTTKFDLSCTRRSGKRREMKHLKLDCKRAPRCPQRTYQSHSTCETPPDEARGMGVYSSARVGWGDSTTTGSIMMTLEIRGLSARTVELRAHLPHWDTTRKEPDKAGDTHGGGDDAASKDILDSRGVEKTSLANSGSQQGERKTRWRNGLPAPPETPPNGFIHPPRTLTDRYCHGRIKTDLQKLSTGREMEWRQGGSPVSPVPPPNGTYYIHKASKGLRHRARLRSNAENKSWQAKWSMAV